MIRLKARLVIFILFCRVATLGCAGNSVRLGLAVLAGGLEVSGDASASAEAPQMPLVFQYIKKYIVFRLTVESSHDSRS